MAKAVTSIIAFPALAQREGSLRPEVGARRGRSDSDGDWLMALAPVGLGACRGALAWQPDWRLRGAVAAAVHAAAQVGGLASSALIADVPARSPPRAVARR